MSSKELDNLVAAGLLKAERPDNCHGKRNMADYQGAFEVDAQLLKDLVAATETISALAGKLGPVRGT
jgi:hypothetical protein